MDIDQDELYEMVPEIWFPVFGTTLEPDYDPVQDTPGLCSGEVSIDGAWKGRVVVQGSHDLLRAGASTMFSLPPDDIQDEDINDTLCELVNIIGGTLKSLMPEPCDLSIPQCVGMSSLVLPSGPAVAASFLCDGQQLKVVIGEGPA